MNLSIALRNIHADPFWWRKVLLGGALNLSIIGAPWAAGLETESLENILKGFPSPLPPNIDPGTRYVIGVFSLVIDFFFFVLPLLVVGLLVLCGIGALALGQSGQPGAFALVTNMVVGAAAVYELAVFLFGFAPIGRLLYVQEGGAERALGMQTLRTALAPSRRRTYWHARLQSLPAYLPFAVLVAAAWASLQFTFPGSWLVTLLLAWLASSALVYAHLVAVQLYGAVERSLG